MDIQILKDHILDYLALDFDHGLISDPLNDPFIQISLINISLINPHRDSFGLYAIQPGRSATHTEFTTAIMATALTLEGKYLVLKPSRGQPLEDIAGCTRGITIGKDQIILITVITNSEDASFVCQSIINEIRIMLTK